MQNQKQQQSCLTYLFFPSLNMIQKTFYSDSVLALNELNLNFQAKQIDPSFTKQQTIIIIDDISIIKTNDLIFSQNCLNYLLNIYNERPEKWEFGYLIQELCQETRELTQYKNKCITKFIMENLKQKFQNFNFPVFNALYFLSTKEGFSYIQNAITFYEDKMSIRVPNELLNKELAKNVEGNCSKLLLLKYPQQNLDYVELFQKFGLIVSYKFNFNLNSVKFEYQTQDQAKHAFQALKLLMINNQQVNISFFHEDPYQLQLHRVIANGIKLSNFNNLAEVQNTLQKVFNAGTIDFIKVINKKKVYNNFNNTSRNIYKFLIQFVDQEDAQYLLNKQKILISPLGKKVTFQEYMTEYKDEQNFNNSYNSSEQYSQTTNESFYQQDEESYD